MKFSIVVPTYNRAQVTKDCISSNIKNAGIPADNIEWIWVNDGSTDDTVEVMSKLCFDISIIRNYNLGIEKTVNQGYALATGDWIFKMDNDFLLPPDWLKTIDKYITTIPETAMIGIPLARYHQPYWSGEIKQINGLDILESKIMMGFCGFSRELFEEVGYLNDNMHYYSSSDVYWSNRASKTGKLIYYIPGIEGLHIGHSNTGGGIEALDPDRTKKNKARATDTTITLEQQKILDTIYYNPFI